MKRTLCAFKTHNQAVAAWGILKKEGIEATLVHIPPRLLREKTCSYGISLLEKHREKVRTILQKNTLEFYMM